MHDCDEDFAEHETAHDAVPISPGPAGGGAAIPASLIPIIVEDPDDYVGVVWLSASRSELTPGTHFVARGRQWVITGLSPSGVTFACRAAKGGGR
jgi:hypothetical protein